MGFSDPKYFFAEARVKTIEEGCASAFAGSPIIRGKVKTSKND